MEGPQAITQRVRGDYDKIMTGIRVFQENGLPLSLSCVVLRSDLHGLPFTYQIADTIDAGKLKLIMPLRKGNALDLDEHEFISNSEAETMFNHLTGLAATYAWRPALRLTVWTPETEGHMTCIEPTGKANAWPVYDAPDLFEALGNVLEEPITEIWKPLPVQTQPRVQVPGREYPHHRARRRPCVASPTSPGRSRHSAPSSARSAGRVR